MGTSESVGSNSVAPKGGKTITNDVRRRLIDAHEADLTYKQMSQLFGVKVDTAYRICSLRKYQVKNRGGSRRKKLNDTHVHFLLEKVESRPDITLNELKEQLDLKGVQVSVSTIARCLEGKLITLKKLEQIPINRICDELKGTRNMVDVPA